MGKKSRLHTYPNGQPSDGQKLQKEFDNIYEALYVVDPDSVPDNTIPATKLTNGSVTDAKLANSAVIAAKIATGAVTTEKVKSGAITSDKLDPLLLAQITSGGGGEGIDLSGLQTQIRNNQKLYWAGVE